MFNETVATKSFPASRIGTFRHSQPSLLPPITAAVRADGIVHRLDARGVGCRKNTKKWNSYISRGKDKAYEPAPMPQAKHQCTARFEGDSDGNIDLSQLRKGTHVFHFSCPTILHDQSSFARQGRRKAGLRLFVYILYKSIPPLQRRAIGCSGDQPIPSTPHLIVELLYAKPISRTPFYIKRPGLG